MRSNPEKKIYKGLFGWSVEKLQKKIEELDIETPTLREDVIQTKHKAFVAKELLAAHWRTIWTLRDIVKSKEKYECRLDKKEFTGKECVCLRCGHIWTSQPRNYISAIIGPMKCPKCRKANWDKEMRNDAKESSLI